MDVVAVFFGDNDSICERSNTNNVVDNLARYSIGSRVSNLQIIATFERIADTWTNIARVITRTRTGW
jgi:hypothetical protein